MKLSTFQAYKEVLFVHYRSAKGNMNVTVIISWFPGTAWEEEVEYCWYVLIILSVDIFTLGNWQPLLTKAQPFKIPAIFQ